MPVGRGRNDPTEAERPVPLFTAFQVDSSKVCTASDSLAVVSDSNLAKSF